MSIKARIVGENGNPVNVNGEGEIPVVLHQHPPIDEEVVALPFRQFFTDNGSPSGSNDMKVNGATQSQDFSVAALQDNDVYIKTIAIEISDAGAALNEFGNLAALTNGISFLWSTQQDGEYIIADELKTNWDMIRMCATQPYGGGGNAFKANNVSGSAEGFTPIFDTSVVFGLPWGLRLRKGTLERLIFRVNDNLSSGIDSFNIIAYGTRI